MQWRMSTTPVFQLEGISIDHVDVPDMASFIHDYEMFDRWYYPAKEMGKNTRITELD